MLEEERNNNSKVDCFTFSNEGIDFLNLREDYKLKKGHQESQEN